MNREHWKEVLPYVQAYAEGKTIERLHIMDNGNKVWYEEKSPDFYFSHHTKHVYRIHPEPKLRPWKPEEVPVGALIREKVDLRCRYVIVENSNGCLWFGYGRHDHSARSFESVLADCEHSIDHGCTWLPCGVEEAQ